MAAQQKPPSEKLSFQQRPEERREGAMAYSGEDVPGRMNSQCKGPQVGAAFVLEEQ